MAREWPLESIGSVNNVTNHNFHVQKSSMDRQSSGGAVEMLVSNNCKKQKI